MSRPDVPSLVPIQAEGANAQSLRDEDRIRGEDELRASRRERDALLTSVRKQALFTVVLYLTLAGLWIALSDRVLGALVSDPETLLELSSYKGLFFVVATAGLLILLLRRTVRTIDGALTDAARHEAERVVREHDLEASRAAAAREELFTSGLIEALPGIFYLYDAQGRFFRWNKNFGRVSGYSAEEVASMHPLDFFNETDRPKLADSIAAVFNDGESSVEAGFMAKDGTTHPYFFTGRRLEFDGQSCLVGVGVDISKRKRAEAELAKSEERFRSTLDTILEGCQLVDFEWRFLYLNEAAATQNRRPNAELMGQRMPDAWPGIEVTTLFAMLSRAMAQRIALHGEHIFHFADGQTGWFDVRAQPVREGLFIMSNDISERKRAEQALHDLNESLELQVIERTRDLEAARERAEAADHIKSSFLATMSHELRTPLNSIIGFTGIVLQGLPGPLNPEQKKQLGMVQGSARHLLDLINDVLDISKIEAGQLEVRSTPFDLAESIERVAASVGPLVAKKGLTLRVDLHDKLGTMVSDRRRFEQIVLNLVNNAAKFTERGGITITASRSPASSTLASDPPIDFVRIDVADTGIGMHEADLERLFQPFRQLDTGLQRQHEGTGLGLAICRRLTDILGGRVSVTSAKGEGSVFTVELPLELRPS